MATWNTTGTRNILITGASDTERTKGVLAFIDQYLVGTAGWTRVGSSDGSTFSWDSTKNIPNVGSHSSIGGGAWACYEQVGGGAQIVIDYPSASDILHMFWSPSGSFVSTGVNATTGPHESGSEPADMVSMDATSQAGQSTDQYISMAYTADGKSFIIFGSTGTNDYGAAAFITLENIKTGDTEGFWALWRFLQGGNAWEVSILSDNTNPQYTAGYHPSSGEQPYTLMEPRFNGGDLFDNIGVDPVSGNHQRLELWCACNQATAYHVRGTCPGIYRISSLLSSGDRLDDAGGGVYDYIVIGNYAVPWGSSDNLQW